MKYRHPFNGAIHHGRRESTFQVRRHSKIAVAITRDVMTTLRPKNSRQSAIPTIAFDLDDTLFNCRDPLMRCLNQHTGQQMHWRDWTHPWAYLHYGLRRRDFLSLMLQHRILERLKPERAALEIIRQAQRKSFQVEIWTARGFYPDARNSTLRILRTAGIEVSDVHIFGALQSKARFLLRRADVALLVDDSPIQARAAISNQVNNRFFLVDRPWNRGFQQVEHGRLEDITLPQINASEAICA